MSKVTRFKMAVVAMLAIGMLGACETIGVLAGTMIGVCSSDPTACN